MHLPQMNFKASAIEHTPCTDWKTECGEVLSDVSKVTELNRGRRLEAGFPDIDTGSFFGSRAS